MPRRGRTTPPGRSPGTSCTRPEPGGHSSSNVLLTAAAGSRSPSTAHPSTRFPDFCRISPSATAGPAGTSCPVSSANSRRATSATASPGSTSPLGMVQCPRSFRTQCGPPGCRGAPRARRRGGARAGSPRSSVRTCRSSCGDDTAAARLHDRSLCGVHKAGSLDGMAWRLTGFVGALASAAFAAGIAHVYLERPDPTMGVWMPSRTRTTCVRTRPTRASSSRAWRSARSAWRRCRCFGCTHAPAGGGGSACWRASPQPSRWWGRGWTCTAIRRTIAPATSCGRMTPPPARTASPRCARRSRTSSGRTVGRALVGSAGVLVIVTIGSLPLLARTDRRRPSPA